MALISTTLGAGAMVQARLSNVANFGVTLADTGLLNAEAQDESQGNVVLVLQALVTARYLRVDLTDGAAQDTLWIARRSDSMADRNRRAIWGAMNAPGEGAAISRDRLPLGSRGFRVVERV